jgi:HEXXH motif-containing protein
MARRHRISAELLALLAQGGGGASGVRRLAAIDLSRRMLFISGVVTVSGQSRQASNNLARQAYELLATVQQETPRAVDAVLRHPAVGAWAWRTMLAASSGRPRGLIDPVGLARIAGAAAIRAGFRCDLPVAVTNGSVMFPSLGQVIVPARTGEWLRLRSSPNGAALLSGQTEIPIPADPHRDTPQWRGLRVISANTDGAGIRLIIDDLDPHRMPLPTLRGRLGTDEVGTWEVGLAGAWRLLVRHHAYLAGEVSAAIRVLTPLSPPTAGSLVSATSRETFGCVGVSTAADPLDLAATLAHEVQHAKLYQITEVEPLALPDDGARFYAPWREDSRPLAGLLQGAYAYLGVAGFWRTQRHFETGENEFRAHVEFARWRDAIASVTRTLLGSGRLTSSGEYFVSRMATVADEWRTERVSTAAAARARDEAVDHARRWHVG